MCDAKNEFEYEQTPWDKWIYDRVDFGIDACQAFVDFLCFIAEWQQYQLLERLLSSCCEQSTGAVLRFALTDKWYVTCDLASQKVKSYENDTEWGGLELPRGVADNLEEMLNQIPLEHRT